MQYGGGPSQLSGSLKTGIYIAFLKRVMCELQIWSGESLGPGNFCSLSLSLRLFSCPSSWAPEDDWGAHWSDWRQSRGDYREYLPDMSDQSTCTSLYV